MDAEPVTPDAFLDLPTPALPPGTSDHSGPTRRTCVLPASTQYPHRRSASHRSARGTHPWPIRRPARFACPVWSALIRPMPPPKGSKPRSAAVHQTHPMGRHGSEEPGFRPAVVSNSWPARAWITKRCCPLFIPSPPKPASGRSARPEGFALPKRPLVCTTVPPLSIDLWLCTSEEAHLRLINRPCPGPSRGFPCSGPNT